MLLHSSPCAWQDAMRYAAQQARLARLELESAPADRLELAPPELATVGADAVSQGSCSKNT
jgi:hypothetical protein